MSPRLPLPGADNGQWGDVLNDYLSQTLASDGSIKTGIVTEDKLADSVKTKLNTTGSSGSTTELLSTTISTSYTLVLSDAGKVIESQSASPITVTVPSNVAVPFPIGTVIEVYRYGAGSVVLAAGSGAVLRSAGNRVTLADQYSSVALRKRAANEWTAVGDLL